MSQLLAYLAAQARSQPGPTLRFVVGEMWRRGRARIHPALQDGLALLSADEFRAVVPLFLPAATLDQPLVAGASWAAATIARAERICRGEFEIFDEWAAVGSQPDWHRDWKSGHRWPLGPAGRLRVLDAPPGADAKRPWELARFHHALTLAAAAAASGDPRFAQSFAALAQDWIVRNPWPRGIHWAMPMEVALRAINWIEAAAIAGAAGHLDASFARELSRSLFLHGRHLWAYREWNAVVRANHYLACVVGLVWLGALFEATPEGRLWLEFGRRELLREMHSQTGPDGVVREGSSGYHAFVAELFLSAALLLARRAARAQGEAPATNVNLASAIERATSPAFAVRLPRLFGFLSALCAGRSGQTDPPIWGDADDGRVLPFGGTEVSPVRVLSALGKALAGHPQPAGYAALDAEIFWRFGPRPESVAPAAKRPAHHSQAFDDSGFYFFSSPRVRGSIRCGPLGIGGWANHAHNDQLSFEFSLGGHPILVDPGLPCYSGDPAARNLFRSTRYHNTIEIAGAEQNRFWPALLFRIVDDTRSHTDRWRANAAGAFFAGSHSGYARLAERAVVRRELHLTPEDTLAVSDRVELAGRAAVAWYFHFAPGVVPEPMQLESTAPPALGLRPHSRWRLGPVLLSVWTAFAPPELESHIATGWVAPRFGRKLAAPVLEFHGRFSGRPEVQFVFAPAGPPGADAAAANRL
jgi:heparinase II/III-like protein